MDINLGDRLEMKKNHPCGGKIVVVLRVGMDFKLKCETCSHEWLMPRAKCEKYIKKILTP